MPRTGIMTPKSRSITASLMLAAGLAVTAFAPAAEAAGPTLSGWGERGNASFMGSISQAASGSLSGHFTIIVHNPGEDPTYCRYLRFAPRYIRGSSWTFDGYGTCWGPYGSFAASNRFVLIDYGSPGAGVDYIDVNFYGAVGVSIPGGLFDDGDITVAP